MSVIVSPRPARRARRPEAGPSPHPVRHERVRLHAEPSAYEVGPYRRRRYRQVPPARRLRRIRHHGALGPAVLHARAADRRPWQLRLHRRRLGGGNALHRGASGQGAPWSCCATSTRKRSTSSPTTTKAWKSPRSCPRAFPNLLVNGSDGHRRRHGHQHPAAQPGRDHRRARA